MGQLHQKTGQAMFIWFKLWAQTHHITISDKFLQHFDNFSKIDKISDKFWHHVHEAESTYVITWELCVEQYNKITNNFLIRKRTVYPCLGNILWPKKYLFGTFDIQKISLDDAKKVFENFLLRQNTCYLGEMLFLSFFLTLFSAFFLKNPNFSKVVRVRDKIFNWLKVDTIKANNSFGPNGNT